MRLVPGEYLLLPNGKLELGKLRALLRGHVLGGGRSSVFGMPSGYVRRCEFRVHLLPQGKVLGPRRSDGVHELPRRPIFERYRERGRFCVFYLCKYQVQ